MINSDSIDNVGQILRHWRSVRRLSQMDLAAEARVSTRHLSFVETGRSRPGYDLVLRLAEVLRLPLRHTNALLIAAGYAPHYTSWTLDDDRTGMVRIALDHLLNQHEPYPAVVIDRQYNIVLTNQGFRQAVTWVTDDETILTRYDNLYKLVFAPDALFPYFTTPEIVRTVLLKRLHEESILYQDETLAQLHTWCSEMCPVAATSDGLDGDTQMPVLTFSLQKGDMALTYFSTITTFGTAIDVTIQELRIESLFPADPVTQAFFQAQAAQS